MHNIRFSRLFLLALLMLALTSASFAGIFISITVAPPPLPVYEQPICPTPGYMWAPGYWSWGDDGYFWVPGTWVPAPQPNYLWTPGYWGWANGNYQWNEGYWGPHIGFYGGVSYGFGYGGVGFVGGEWRNGGFFYNTAVMHVGSGGGFSNNVYVNKTVIVNNTTINNVSFNGGSGGVQARPTPAEESAAHENHVQPTAQQTQHVQTAAKNPQLLAKNNGGKPAIAATAKAGDFSSKSAVPAKSAGGKVDPATLKANAKTMPPPSKTAAAPAPKTAAAPATHNVPKPPTAANKPAPKPMEKTAPKPPTAENKPAPKPMEKSAPKPASKPPAPAVHNNPPPKPPAARTQERPAPKPAPKPAAKPAPKEEEKEKR